MSNTMITNHNLWINLKTKRGSRACPHCESPLLIRNSHKRGNGSIYQLYWCKHCNGKFSSWDGGQFKTVKSGRVYSRTIHRTDAIPGARVFVDGKFIGVAK